MKTKIFFIFIGVLCFSVCNSNEDNGQSVTIIEKAVIRSRTGEGIEYREEKKTYPKSTKTFSLHYELGHFIAKIEGVENLNNVKNLYLGYGLLDYSFLDKMENVEVLMLDTLDREPIDFGFLKNMKKLKIFICNDVIFNKNTIDFGVNTKLRYILIRNISYSDDVKKQNRTPVAVLSGVSRSVKIINLYIPGDFIISRKSVSDIDGKTKIILSKRNQYAFDSDSRFIEDHRNIIFTDNESEALPAKYDIGRYYKLFGMNY